MLPKNPKELLASLTRKRSKSKRDVPRKAFNPNRKARYARYLAASTCIVCGKVFRTPNYKAAHTRSFCKEIVGLRRSTSVPE